MSLFSSRSSIRSTLVFHFSASICFNSENSVLYCLKISKFNPNFSIFQVSCTKNNFTQLLNNPEREFLHACGDMRQQIELILASNSQPDSVGR